MSKRWSIPLLLAACQLAVGPAGAALEREDLVRLGASVLRVEAVRAGGYAFGSGVTVGHEMVVTNCHVTRDASQILVARGGARHAVTAQVSDIGHDLCLLQVPGLRARTVPVGQAATLEIGQALTAFGFTGGASLQVSVGEVVQLHRYDAARVIQSSNRFNSGASGGALFDDNGTLVGILTFRMRGAQAHYFAAPAEWVQPLLDKGQRGGFVEVLPLPPPRLAYWEEASSNRPPFLQAATLQNESRWDELQAHARAWLRLDSDDAEPWVLLGMALVGLGRSPEARPALECALRLDPTNRVARQWLAHTLPASTSWLDPEPECAAS